MNTTTMNRFDNHSTSMNGTVDIGNNDFDVLDDDVFVRQTTCPVVAAGETDNDNDQGEDNDDDDDDESEDENANLKQIRPGHSHGGSSSSSSIRRNDSFTSFLTRSERISILGKDPPPTEQEAVKRRIRFRDTLTEVYEIEKVDKHMKNQYWMTDDDFDRIETDIKMTQFRYENSKTGKIPFDNEKNSIRGLESILDGIDVKLYKHRQSVLQEIHQQKSMHGHVNDWEKVRHTSEINSDQCRAKAVHVARQDELEHKKAWGMISGTGLAEKAIAIVTEPINAPKKKNPLLFWKKH